MAVKSELSEQKLGYIREFVNDKDPKEEYKLLQSIGTGTYGEVYKALRLRTRELAAVKIIKIDAKDDVRAILQEIQTLRECKHANIVEYFGSYFRNNKLWICMEFCGGFSMQDIYTNLRRPIEENCIAFVTRETLRGIEYMHMAGKIHRDIKGANILLTNDGEVKIADFGVAAQITQTIQRRNSFIGTPYWMAPEVAAVERKGGYDEKCDIWALGITAMEYAELQPPLFDLHPMRALRILGMRSYKPPTLRNKAAWSPKFHSFLKAALTKNEKKRPTAQLLLRHELVTQPNLTRQLTCKLLEMNRHPERYSDTTKSVAHPPYTSADVRPNNNHSVLASLSDVSTPRVQTPLSPTSEETKTPPKSSLGNIPNASKRKISPSVNERPQPPEKMHTPWHDRILSPSSASTPSSPSTPVASPTADNPMKAKLWVPAERITPSSQLSRRPDSDHPCDQRLGVLSNPSSAIGKSPLEQVRIMDELPTPLPAYVSMAPTASPALKPPGECGQLLASGKSPKSALGPTVVDTKSESGDKSPKPVEALVQQVRIVPSQPGAPTRIAVSDSSAIASSVSSESSGSSSSCPSASTSPRSSCSSLLLEAINAAEQKSASRAKTPLISGSSGVQPVPVSTAAAAACNGDGKLPSRTNGTVPESITDLKASSVVGAPEHLTVFEPVIHQDSVEAQFLPIDTEPHVVAALVPEPKSEMAQISSSGKTANLPRAVLADRTLESPCDDSDRSSSSEGLKAQIDEQSHSDDATSSSEGFLEDEHLSMHSYCQGSVTTIESHGSAVSLGESLPEQIPEVGNDNSNPQVNLSRPHSANRTAMKNKVVEKRLTDTKHQSAPRASVENEDEWDLDVADDELLAADGLLNMNRSRPDSISDRISEFGFRIHGSSEEDEGDEDDYLDDDDQNGVIIPDDVPNLDTHLFPTTPTPNHANKLKTDKSTEQKETVSSDDSGHHTDAHTNENTDDRVTNGQVNGGDGPKIVAVNQNGKKSEEIERSPLDEFYPDKSGEELMSLLRQLKFAQKFAWLSGSSVLPTTISALTNLQSAKISLNGSTPSELNESAKRSEPSFPMSNSPDMFRKKEPLLTSTESLRKTKSVSPTPTEGSQQILLLSPDTAVKQGTVRPHSPEPAEVEKPVISPPVKQVPEDSSTPSQVPESLKINEQMPPQSPKAAEMEEQVFSASAEPGKVVESVPANSAQLVTKEAGIKKPAVVENHEKTKGDEVSTLKSTEMTMKKDTEVSGLPKTSEKEEPVVFERPPMERFIINSDTEQVTNTIGSKQLLIPSVTCEPETKVTAPVYSAAKANAGAESVTDVPPSDVQTGDDLPHVSSVETSGPELSSPVATIQPMVLSEDVLLESVTSIDSEESAECLKPCSETQGPPVEVNALNLTKLNVLIEEPCVSAPTHLTAEQREKSASSVSQSDLCEISEPKSPKVADHSEWDDSVKAPLAQPFETITPPEFTDISETAQLFDFEEPDASSLPEEGTESTAVSKSQAADSGFRELDESEEKQPTISLDEPAVIRNRVNEIPLPVSKAVKSRTLQFLMKNGLNCSLKFRSFTGSLQHLVSPDEITSASLKPNDQIAEKISVQPSLPVLTQSSAELSSIRPTVPLSRQIVDEHAYPELRPQVIDLSVQRQKASTQSSTHPLTRPAQLLRSEAGSRPNSGSSGSRTSRFSMIELSHVNERPLYSSCSGLPSTPQVHMGACFSLVFEGCPLKINSTATWTNPMTNSQVILFGTNDGIYYLSLKDLADSSLELLFPRRCLWLTVVRDTMMSLSGRHPQLYSHNLVSLMKLKSQGHAMNGSTWKLGKLSMLFPKRFSPSKKIPETKGCQRVSVTRSPFNGAKYLCAAVDKEILVMEWFHPVSSFIEIKRIYVPEMPSPLLTFDLLIIKDRPLPLVCLGVYRHHSKRGREGERFRLNLVDLNAPSPLPPSLSAVGSPVRPSRLSLNSPKVAKSDLIEMGKQPNGSKTPARSAGDEISQGTGSHTESQQKNEVFLPEDILPVVDVVQLENNAILVCFQDCAKVISLNGRIKSSRHRATTLDFNGSLAESIVCLRDSILVFHPHGLLGKSFTGELTQEIHDEKHIYRLLGCDRNIVVESRPADDPMSNSNVYLLAGHTDSHIQ
ncbi:unnamed protein product [Calicophoron daubneyi]|uniref:non-specific serine/threonine protein kinase n=1 Tax=Calicophoron daubneyi TaxID=300641 RepID=A0AAV2TSC4_CALDB